MIFLTSPALFVLLLAGAAPHADDTWVYKGLRTCVFDQDKDKPKAARRCVEYVQQSDYKVGSTTVSSFLYKWKMGNRFEVQYRPRRGIVGISNFTVGEIYDKTAPFSGRNKSFGVTYSDRRDHLVVGTVNDNYIFSVEGGL